MKKILFAIIFCIMLIPSIIYAEQKELNMYLFYGNGCPHCAALEKYLDEYLKDKPNIKLYEYEVWSSEENRNKLKDIFEITNVEGGIPYLIVGNNVITGFLEGYTEENIVNTVNYYLNIDYEDKVGIYLGLAEGKGTIPEEKYEENIENISAPNNLKKIIKK